MNRKRLTRLWSRCLQTVAGICSCVLLLSVAGCAEPLEETTGSQGISTSLALSLKNAGSGNPDTKMTGAVIQTEGNPFRGIERLYIIPFKTDQNGSEAVVPGAVRWGGNYSGVQYAGFSNLVNNNKSHLYKIALVPSLTNHLLVYGQAASTGDISTKEQKHRNGVLYPSGLEAPAGSDDISFALETILDNAEASELDDKVTLLIGKLNAVVTAVQNATDPVLLQVLDTIARDNEILACSYPTFNRIKNEIVAKLFMLPALSDPTAAEPIQTAVSEFESALASVGGIDFPTMYGIPEGAVGFWWNGETFVRLINGVNIALVAPDSYCYPPSLWYYANSAIKTSDSDAVTAKYTSSQPTWNDILACYQDGETVLSSTRSTAIVDPLQYGVGMMEISVAAEANNDDIARALGCPLTGVIVGDQKDVDFRFSPRQGSGIDSRFVYDNVIEGDHTVLSADEQEKIVVSTLLLPSGSEQTVHFALEFLNNTRNVLPCQQGYILPGCKFYLAGFLNLADLEQPAGGETLSSIIVQDHKTLVSAKAVSLGKAYNTVPDLRDPKLEIGIVAEMQWKQVTPGSVKMNY